VAKQHESSFLYDIREGRLFRHTPHFTVGNVVVPANMDIYILLLICT